MNEHLKNIRNLMKYIFRYHKTLYIISAVVILLSMVLDGFIGKFTRGVELIPVITLLLTVNIITHLIMFSREVSKEYGKLLFMAPINGIDFILGNLFEFIGSQLIITILPVIWNWIAAGKITKPLFSIALPSFFGFLTFYLMVTAIMAIINCYVKESGLRALCVIGSLIIVNMIYSLISKLILSILPYIYISISGIYNTEIDLFSCLISITALIALQFCAAYHINNKLEIS